MDIVHRQKKMDSTIGKLSYLSHAMGIFLREECVIDDEHVCGCVVVPAELPLGIQFHVSSINLFNFAIETNPNVFFNADSKMSIGMC